MLARIKQFLEQAMAEAAARKRRQRERIEEYAAQDPVASRTEWGPAAGGGANFRTRKLVQVSPSRVEFKPAAAGRIFPLVFLVTGLGVLGFGVFVLLSLSPDEPLAGVFVLVFGALFAGIGAVVWWLMSRPIVFDRIRGCFWKGGSEPSSAGDIMGRKNATALSRIHALQLVAELVRSSSSSSGSSSYRSYEINLVLDDGSRINVIDHGKLDHIRSDAQLLAQFLGVPVWDVI